MEDFGVAFQRYLLAALAALVAIVFWTGTTDPVNVPKLTVVTWVTVLILLVGALRLIVERRVVLLTGPAVWATAALAGGLVIAMAGSDVRAVSFWGVLGRGDGLLLYACCLVAFLTTLRVYDAQTLRVLVYGMLAGGVVLAGYGLLQAAGIDPVNWADIGLSPILGTLGNPDFEAAYVGIMLPLAAWGALTRTWSQGWRIGSAVLAFGCLVVAVASSSSQGLLAGAAGMGIVVAALLLARGDVWARRGLILLGSAVALLVALVGAGVLFGIGPGDRVVGSASLSARKWYWSSAIDMWQSHPLAGVGPGRYGAYYRSVRPDAAADAQNFSDAAHNVPLHFLATGGLVVVLPYLILVGLIGWASVRGMRRLEGEERLLLSALVGAWVAYQVQSLVSIDQPALAVVHWLLAAGVLAMALPPSRVTRLLPGAVVPKSTKGRSAKVLMPQRPVWSGGSTAAASVIAIVAVAALVYVLSPLRADYAARAAAVHLAQGRGNPALASYQLATDRAPYVAAYWLRKGKFLEQVKQVPMAQESYEGGLRNDPRSFDLLVAAARLARQEGDTTAVDRYRDELHRIDPEDTWREAVDS